MAAAENVDVQVRHGFAAVRAVVDDEPVAAFLQTNLVRDFGVLEQQMAQQFFTSPVKLQIRPAANANSSFSRCGSGHPAI